jgi:hypothetical protein
MTMEIKTPPANATRSMIAIESDLCLDNGTIVATGPCAKLDRSTPGGEREISGWTNEFAEFLHNAEIEARSVLRELL